jgi:RimJ/RimL family protein N-acetyltransferase
MRSDACPVRGVLHAGCRNQLAARYEVAGRGLAREAAEAILKFGFDSLELNRVVAFTAAANAPSWGLMERLGMRKIGEFNNPKLPEGHDLRRNLVYDLRAPRL